MSLAKRRLATTLVLVIVTATTLAAATVRTVTIRVVDAAGAPVAEAQVRIAADEMDAVGTTDSRGEVRLGTTSNSIRVEVVRGQETTAVVSSASSVTVRVAGGDR